MNRRHSIALAAASSCGATLLVGGIAWAAIPGDGGVINACYGKVSGIVRVIDVAKGEKCITAFEVPFSWNQKGQKGDAGLPGAPGAPGMNGHDGDDGVSPTVDQLAPGDPNCPAGGAAITDADGSTAFVCSGQDGSDGQDGEDGQPFSGTFTSPSGEYSISVTNAGISLARGNAPVVQIVGSNIEITGQNVSVVSDLDATILAGRNATISTGQNATISTGRDASVSIGRNFILESGLQTALRSGSTSLQSDSQIAIQSSGSTSLQSDSQIAIQSAGTTSVQSSATLTLDGSQVHVNGGGTCLRAARLGDTVNNGQIVTGSTTVCIG